MDDFMDGMIKVLERGHFVLFFSVVFYQYFVLSIIQLSIEGVADSYDLMDGMIKVLMDV